MGLRDWCLRIIRGDREEYGQARFRYDDAQAAAKERNLASNDGTDCEAVPAPKEANKT